MKSKKQKKVAVVGTVGIPACYGGFETLVENLILNKDTEYTVFCASKSYSEKIKTYNGAKLIYLPFQANGVQSIPYDICSLIRSIFLKVDSILILGVSGCVFLPFLRLFSGKKIITNIDGLEWKRDKWGRIAKNFLKFSEKMAVKFSDVVITDNQAISEYVMETYGKESQVIAYGGDHALLDFELSNDFDDYYLSICRIEPENNIELILRAFSKSENRIKFVGNWDNSEYGRNLKSNFKNYKNISLIDPIYDLKELFKLRACCLGYVHGHSAGGTNPSLVEMMHFGKDILAFNCKFNRYSTDDKAKYFLNSNELNSLISNRSLSDNGAEMKKLADLKYKWSIVSKSYQSCY